MTDVQGLVLIEARKIADAKFGGSMTTEDIVKSFGAQSKSDKETLRRAVQFHLRRGAKFLKQTELGGLVRTFDEASSGRRLTFRFIGLSS